MIPQSNRARDWEYEFNTLGKAFTYLLDCTFHRTVLRLLYEIESHVVKRVAERRAHALIDQTARCMFERTPRVRKVVSSHVIHAHLNSLPVAPRLATQPIIQLLPLSHLNSYRELSLGDRHLHIDASLAHLYAFSGIAFASRDIPSQAAAWAANSPPTKLYDPQRTLRQRLNNGLASSL